MPVTPEQAVVVRFTSGLGNQLFQLACGMAVAATRGACVQADTTWFDLVAKIHRPIRRFRLGRLRLDLAEAFAPPRRQVIGLAAAAYDRWGRGRGALERLGRMKVVQERRPMHAQCLDHLPAGRIYLNGYWQTAGHFQAARDALRQAISPRQELSPGASSWMARIQGGRTAFLHVRRGDYAKLVGDHGLLPVDYYRRAAGLVCDFTGSDVRWLVFAEDKDWAKAHMGFLGNWDLVEYESADRDVEDLQLMGACEAAVIANSSYSWWGAALGDRPGRLVVAPDRYWNRPGADTEAWILPSWTSTSAWS